MISETAGRAMQIRSGLETCKSMSSSDWRAIVDRIVYDLDKSGDTFGTEIVKGILWDAWNAFPDKPGMSDLLSERVQQAGEEEGG